MNKVIILSAPSGCGKTSLVKELIKLDNSLIMSISHTTRKIRKNEKYGVDYYFTDINSFKKLKEKNEFIESAKVFDNYYGTSKKSLNNLLKTNNVIIEIDWQGARQIKKIINNCISIFILPPSIEELEKRLNSRGDSQILIKRRMLDATSEIAHADEFDYSIINDDFNATIKQLQKIINK